MIIKTYTDSSITLKGIIKITESINSITIYYDTEFDEYKVQMMVGEDNERLYLKAIKGHVKIYKSMKSVYSDIAVLLQRDELAVNLILER